MVVNCLIEFESNPHGVYFAGQTINVRVTLEANKLKTCEGVTVKVHGFAYTSFEKSSDDNVSASETYFSSETNLIEPAKGESQLEIIPGIHTFTFSCVIPSNCPSSYETWTYGHIRYLVVVTLKRSWKFNQTYSKGFTVIKNLDINLEDPTFKTALTNEEQKYYGCGPCKTDPLTLQLTLPSTGFVPGQNIPVTVIVDNETNIDVKEVIVELWLKVIYRAANSQYSECSAISKVKGDEVIRYTKKMFTYFLPVPPTPPSDTTHSNLIHLLYEVRLNASVKGAHLKKFTALPVTIGSILTTSQGFIVNQPRSSGSYEHSLMDSATVTNLNGNDEQKDLENIQTIPAAHWSSNMPIVFQETLYMPPALFSFKNDYGEQKFKPMFAVYNLSEYSRKPEIPEMTTWL